MTEERPKTSAIVPKSAWRKAGLAGGCRVLYKVTAVALWTAACFCVRAAGLAVSVASRKADDALRRWIFVVWAKGILAIAGVRRRVDGTPPRRPFFSVSNHLTNLDLILLASQTRCIFVAREDVGRWPVLGPIIRSMRTILIDRAKRSDTVRVNELICDAMASGDGVHVFAESRIAQDGQVHPFKPALLQPPVDLGVPVHYAVITYATPEGYPPASEVLIWRHGVSFAQNVVNILSLPYLCASVTFGDEPIVADNRKELAEELCEAVRERFRPLDAVRW